LGLCGGDEGLVAEIVCEGEGLDEFFKASQGRGVTVAVDVLQIGSDTAEEFGDFLKTSVYVLLNVRREVFVEVFDSVTCEQTFTEIDILDELSPLKSENAIIVLAVSQLDRWSFRELTSSYSVP
jgi:hypothetical protein